MWLLNTRERQDIVKKRNHGNIEKFEQRPKMCLKGNRKHLQEKSKKKSFQNITKIGRITF